MSLKKWFSRFLAVLYATFGLLMICAAISSLTSREYIGLVIFLPLAVIGFYMAFKRWKRDKSGPAAKEYDADEMPAANGKAAKKKSALSIIGWTLLSLVVIAIIFWIGSIFVASRSNIRYMESAAVPLIEALEKYKRTNGSYPDTLQQLQPAFISALPVCRPGSSSIISYNLDKDQDMYNLNCYTGMYAEKRRYNSQTGRWSSWD